jgi:voltage-gated potassium channel
MTRQKNTRIARTPMISKRLALFAEFVRAFAYYGLHVRELIVSLLLLIVLGGCVISKIEGIKLGDAIYFAFITALSIGYGDISPETAMGKILSVAIGFVGMLFVGITVAIATHALGDTAKRHPAPKK